MSDDERMLAALAARVGANETEILRLRDVAHGLRASTQPIVDSFGREVAALEVRIKHLSNGGLSAIESRLRAVEDENLANRSKSKVLLDGWAKVWSVLGPILVIAIVAWARLR